MNMIKIRVASGNGLLKAHMFSYLNSFSDSVHNLIDEMIIAASFILYISPGIATTLAVIFTRPPRNRGLRMHASRRSG